MMGTNIDKTQYETKQLKLLNFIRKSQNCTLRSIARKFRDIRAQERAEIIQHLKDTREIYEEKNENGKAGRPTLIYRSVIA
jgi:hypothetical protein